MDVDFWKEAFQGKIHAEYCWKMFILFLYICMISSCKTYDPNEPQVKSLRARKLNLKRVIVYWKYYDKEMYDFYHFPHWTLHAVFCNITYDKSKICPLIYELHIEEDFIIMYIQRFIWLSVSVFWLSIQTKQNKI